MKKVSDFLHDAAICIVAGLAVAALVTVVAAIISVATNGFDTYNMMNTIRSGLLIIGALIMFCLAGIMLGDKSNRKIRNSEKWKSTFRVVGPSLVFLFISVTILAVATIVDYIVWLS